MIRQAHQRGHSWRPSLEGSIGACLCAPGSPRWWAEGQRTAADFCLRRRGRVSDPVAMPDADAAPALPDDVASLKAMVLAQTAELAEIRSQRQAQEAELAAARARTIEQRFEIEALKSRLARLQRMTFGRSSEKLRDQVEQLELTLADIDEMLGEITPANDPADEQAEIPAHAQPARRPLCLRLCHVDIVEHAAPCACPGCGGAIRPFSEDVTEILDYVPGSFRVIRHVRPETPVVPGVRDDCPGAGSQPADPPWSCRSRSTGACAGGEILRSSPAVSPG